MQVSEGRASRVEGNIRDKVLEATESLGSFRSSKKVSVAGDGVRWGEYGRGGLSGPTGYKSWWVLNEMGRLGWLYGAIVDSSFFLEGPPWLPVWKPWGFRSGSWLRVGVGSESSGSLSWAASSPSRTLGSAGARVPFLGRI